MVRDKAKLSMLAVGESATIAGVDGTNGEAKRLADLGFVRGARLCMVKSGVPCIVRVEQQRVGLGAIYQERILLDMP